MQASNGEKENQIAELERSITEQQAKLDKLKGETKIQAVIDTCPLSVPAMNHMKSVCSQMFKYAIDQEIVTTNYATLVELPTKEESEEDLGANVALI